MSNANQSSVTLNVQPTVALRPRSQSAGDPIRGDLVIPTCPGQWFASHQSFNPSSALQQGAMLAMFGGSDSGTGSGIYNATQNAQLNALGGQTGFVSGEALTGQLGMMKGGINNSSLDVATAA